MCVTNLLAFTSSLTFNLCTSLLCLVFNLCTSFLCSLIKFLLTLLWLIFIYLIFVFRSLVSFLFEDFSSLSYFFTALYFNLRHSISVINLTSLDLSLFFLPFKDFLLLADYLFLLPFPTPFILF